MPSAKEARDSYMSYLDYYFGRPSSREVVLIGLRVGDVPTEAQGEYLRGLVEEAIRVGALLDALSPEEIEQLDRLAIATWNARGK